MNYQFITPAVLAALLKTCGSADVVPQPSATAPVAVAASVHAVGPYVMIDGSKSYDPRGKPLTYIWTIPSPPQGWNTSWGGFVDQTAKGTVAFYTYVNSDIGRYHGSFDVVLTVSNGTETSRPVTVPVNICCAPTDTATTASAFTAKLPKYSIAEAMALYSAYKATDWASNFKFAASYGFGFPQLDFLKGLPAGSSLAEWRARRNSYVWTGGGATIENYALNFDNVVQVQVDLSKVTYPFDYQASNARTAAVVDPYCNNAPSMSTFRAVDLGSHALPTIEAVALPSGTLKLAAIKDIWDIMTPGLGESCQKDVALSWSTTLDRLVTLGVDAISINPWTYFHASASGWSIPVAGTSPRVSQMTDENVRWIVGLAKARGLKVYWVNQLQAVVKSDGSFLVPESTTAQDVRRAISALTVYLAERGRALQSIGIDGVILGSWYWVNFANYLDPGEFADANVRMIGALKQGFTGDIVYAPSSSAEITPALNGVVNRYVYNQYVGFDADSIRNYSVAAVRAQYAAGVQAWRAAAGGRPLVFDASIQSRAGFFLDPRYYDPFCTADGADPCVQASFAGDYGMQAIYAEAVLETASGSPDPGGVIMPYFVDPNLLPPQNFYNIDATVRGKPAEYLFYRWFNQR